MQEGFHLQRSTPMVGRWGWGPGRVKIAIFTSNLLRCGCSWVFEGCHMYQPIGPGGWFLLYCPICPFLHTLFFMIPNNQPTSSREPSTRQAILELL